MTVHSGYKKKDYSTIIFIGVFTLFGIVLAIQFMAPAADPFATPSTVASIEKGEKIFEVNCQGCHGKGAVGEDLQKKGGGEKSTGGYIAPALNGTAHTWHHPNEMLLYTIKNGSLDETSQMRGFKDRLSEEEIVSVIHYFQSLWPKKLLKRRNQKPD